MKIKNLLVIVLILGSFAALNAQTFEKGDKVLNLGVGLGGYGTWGYGVSIPPVSASFEVGVKDEVLDKGSIGIGGYLAYASYKDNALSDYYWTFRRTVIGARGLFHYPLVDKLDTYAGLMLGYNMYSWTWHGGGNQGIEPGSSGVGFSGFIGGRYYFTEKLAGMLELGYGISYLNIGVALKF
jgi:hypothetical protein